MTRKPIQEDDGNTHQPESSNSSFHPYSRKRSRKNMMTSSPYFQNPSVRNQQRKDRSSSYFQKSPSSTYGSIRSMGPLIHTWTGRTSTICGRIEDGESTFTDTTSQSFHQKPCIDLCNCQSCDPVIQGAMAHFQECPIFQKRLMEANAVQPMDSSLPYCTPRMQRKLEYAVRHLCPHQCFLKAYAPSREWVFFRKEVHEYCDEPVDQILKDWSCRLVVEVRKVCNRKEMERENQNEETPPKRKQADDFFGPGGKIEPSGALRPLLEFYCSKTQTSYSTRMEAIRALGLRDGTQAKRKAQEQTLVNCKDDHGSVKKNVVPDGLMLSRMPTPDLDPSHITPRPLPTSRRRLRMDPTTKAEDSFPSPCPSLIWSFDTSRSPLGLLEELFVNDPWQLLVSTILLNKSRRAQVDYILWGLLERWPTPQALLAGTNVSSAAKDPKDEGDNNEHDQELRDWIQPLGLQNRRSQGLIQFCKEYLSLLEGKQNERSRIAVGEAKTVSRFAEECPNEESKRFVHSDRDVAFHLTRADVLGLYHCGDYAADAYQIFISNFVKDGTKRIEWKYLHPKDHALAAYVEWKRSFGN